ncbi:MAG: sulfate/molybdate ABC transporter ATP-binding protein [Ilumatobacter sp.]
MTATGLDAVVRRRLGSFELDMALRIEPGETVALLGPNGAGKSTTVSALSGWSGPSSGTHIQLAGRELDGDDVFVYPEHRRIGVVSQDPLLFEHLTVLDNVAFAARSRGASRRASRRDAQPWLERLDLADISARTTRDLSGGQAQRVAIARALAAEPDLLLFDEPLSALDVESRTVVRRMLRTHLEAFTGPRLLITHDPGDAVLLADRLDVIENGRITQSGSVDAIRRAPTTEYAAALAGTNLFTGTANAGAVLMNAYDHSLTIADTSLMGAVLLTIHPAAVSLHPERPSGSHRNTWPSTVELLEPLGDIVRVTLGAPLPVAVDVTPAAVASLGLAPGSSVWAAVKATEINSTPA